MAEPATSAGSQAAMATSAMIQNTNDTAAGGGQVAARHRAQLGGQGLPQDSRPIGKQE